MANKKPLLALNLGSQRVSLARFSQAKGGLVLQDYASTELMPDPAADSARVTQTKVAVAELAAKIGQKSAPVRVAISGHSVFSRFVKLPAMSDLDEEKIDELVGFEAQQNVPFPMDEVKWDYQLVSDGSDGGELEAVLVAIKSDAINEINDAVESSGLQTQRIDVAPMAIYNAFRYNYSEVTDPALIIDVGARTTNLIYAHGNRVFTRSLPEGGAATTSAIAKEFDVTFIEAEEMKVRDGFVSLGGNYADHEDPQIASMSKVIRNTMTRLHSNVVRTTSAYRQQGGTAPTSVYLCGGSAALPYLREFFMEKLDLPVEYFNGVKNVSVGSKIDGETLGADAHNLGELVGLGLRGMVSCPMELDIVPDVVERRRDIKRRKPFLITASICLLGTLAAAGMYFTKTAGLADQRRADLDTRVSELEGINSAIRKERKRQAETKAKAEPLRQAIFGRTFNLELFNYINSKFTGDKLWLTQIEPMIDGKEIKELSMSTLWDGPDSNPVALVPDDPIERKSASPEGAPKMINGIRIYGLYREDQSSVYALFDAIKKDDSDGNPFNFEDREDKELRRVIESDPTKWAQPFRFNFPLKEPIELPVLTDRK
ncbi:MAG: type IV pilus assembly protein PilM [Pseudoalteromonas tetraodonis]|jgi:type IV pilus assembly protein PilM